MSQKPAAPVRMGRPATVNATTGIMVKMSADMRASIERHSKVLGVTMSESARRLIALGLKHWKPAGTVRRPVVRKP